MKKAPSVTETERARLALGGIIIANIGFLPDDRVKYYLQESGKKVVPETLLRGFGASALDLSKTGPTFGDWLRAREELFKFQTGLVVNLCNMFAVSNKLLIRTDIMPIFRPAGATNRTAVRWMTEAGMSIPYEEVSVTEYSNSGGGGSKVPELYYINRSVQPDKDTLGDNAKSPDALVALAKVWCGLYGYGDAATLHFLVTGKLLDPETWTWFPNDRLPYGYVAYGSSNSGRVRFNWDYRGNQYSNFGARATIPVPFKT